jgi:hypothetical protein
VAALPTLPQSGSLKLEPLGDELHGLGAPTLGPTPNAR